MKISQELEQKILAMSGVVVRHAGQPAAAPDESEPAKPTLVQAGVAVSVNVTTGEIESLVAMVPLKTVSEANQQRGQWRQKNRRGNEAWKAVSKTLGPHLRSLATFAEAYHANKGLRVTFSRLGGRGLDPMANLGAALKSVEDAVAFLIGADDRDARWHAIAAQRPGKEYGVEVRIEVFPE